MKLAKFISVCLVLMMIIAVIPVSAASYYTGEYDLSKRGYTVDADGEYRIFTSAKTKNVLNITNAKNVTVYLDNLDISTDRSCITVTNSNVKFVLMGNNSLVIADVTKVGGGINTDGNSKITVEGDGSLNVIGGAYMAAIGTKHDLKNDTAEIVINSGKITAKAGNEAAAIGAGRNSGAKITINGGSINATSVKNGAAIGAGRDANLVKCVTDVTINGGVINTYGGANSSGIGSAFRSIANVTVNGGVISAKPGHAKLFGIDVNGIDNSGVPGVLTVNGGSILALNEKSAEKPLTNAQNAKGEKLSAIKVNLPKAESAPYKLEFNGKVETFDALGKDSALTLYKPSGDTVSVLYGKSTYIAKSNSANVKESDFVKSSADARHIGYQKTEAKDGKFDVRLVAGLDNAKNYTSVGYTVIISGNKEKVFYGTSDKIYQSLVGTDKNGNVFVAANAEEYKVDGLFAATLRNLPTTGNYSLTVICEAEDSKGISYSNAYTYSLTNGVLSEISK